MRWFGGLTVAAGKSCLTRYNYVAEVTSVFDVEGRFWELCDEAVRHGEAGDQKLGDESASPDDVQFESQATEQAMVKIIELVEANPDHRSTFVRCFCELVVGERPQP